jgi:hypothetical protein
VNPRPWSVAAAVVVIAATVACSGGPGAGRASSAPSPSATASAARAQRAEPVLPTLKPLEIGSRGVPPPARTVSAAPPPTRIQLPAIGIDASLVRLDLDRDGVIEVPTDFNRPGWYRRGPAPGEDGAAVILGHLDSYTGPAVFWRLPSLHPGDTILISREDGSQLTFAVQRTVSYSVDTFPSFDVYGVTPRPELRLITCGGTYSASRRQYLSNVVIFAALSA